jgi:predicted transcriptional regulator
MTNLTGKTEEQIGRALKELTWDELIGVIHSLATVEEAFTPAEIARRKKMSKRDVIREMKAGKMGGGYFSRSFNSLKVSASGVNEWWARFWVPVNGSNGGKAAR